MWLGLFENDVWLSDDQKAEFPSIAKLGQSFNDFQNSPYRGDWIQQKKMTFGEIRDLLKEVAILMKQHQEITAEQYADDEFEGEE